MKSGDRVKLKSLGHSGIALHQSFDHTLTGQQATAVSISLV